MSSRPVPLPLPLPGPREEDLYRCVHCGLCLNACPTYTELGLETESPRGRIALMKALHEERIELTPRVASHFDLCLQCRACEAVCPSGVPYGRLMEATRAQMWGQGQGPLFQRALIRLALRHLFPYPGRLHLVAGALRTVQRFAPFLGPIARRLPGSLGRAARQAPPLSRRFFGPRRRAYPPSGPATRRVVLLSGCVMPLVHGPTLEAAVAVLARQGCRVSVAPGQVCCGALSLHAGDRQGAQKMARTNIDAFLAQEPEAIVTASAGCSAALKGYGELLQGDIAYAEKAHRVGVLVQDITEFLDALPLSPPTVELPLRVTYQDPCHLAHAQGISEAPRRLLEAIPGLELVEMEDPTQCCGAGGLHGLFHPEMTEGLLAFRMGEIAQTRAQVVATANPGCMLQLQWGVKQARSNVRVCHVVDLLAAAYAREDPEASPAKE